MGLFKFFSSQKVEKSQPDEPETILSSQSNPDQSTITKKRGKNKFSKRKAGSARAASANQKSKNAIESKSETSEMPKTTLQKRPYVTPLHLRKKKDAGQQQQSLAKTKQNKEINNLLKKNTQELMSSLTPEVKKAFETLYQKLDINESGGINAKEIQNLISKNTQKELTMKEIQSVLTELDLKGTGDIEFDEFIYMLSQPENYVRLLDNEDLKKIQNDLSNKGGDLSLKHKIKNLADNKEKYENDEKSRDAPTNIFFRALRKIAQQDSMTILRSFYTNKLKKLNDHVIHDWSAGQRCIGLSDQEMVKRYETIQGELLRQKVNFCKDSSYKSSPYAKPLEWGLVTLREGIEERRTNRLNNELNKNKSLSERRAKISEFISTPKAVELPKYEIAQRHPLKKSFNYDQLANIRTKVDKIADTYYTDLKTVANENSKMVRKELAVESIKSKHSRENFEWTFKAYSAPFVVSPWIPVPSANRGSSHAPLGKSKFYSDRKW